MNIQLFPFISETLIGAILLLATIILYNNRHWPEETPVRSYSAYAVLCLLSFYYICMEGKSLGFLCNPLMTGKLSVVYFLALSLFIVANYSHSMIICLRVTEKMKILPYWEAGFWSWPVFLLLTQIMPAREGDLIIVFILWQIFFAMYMVVEFEQTSSCGLGILLLGSYMMLVIAFVIAYLEMAMFVNRWIAIAVPCVMGILAFKTRYRTKRKMFDSRNFRFYGAPGQVFVSGSYVTEEQMVNIIEENMAVNLGSAGLDRKLEEEFFDCLDFAEVANLFIIQYCRNSGQSVSITDSIAKRLNGIIYSSSNEYRDYTYRDLFNFLQNLMEGKI